MRGSDGIDILLDWLPKAWVQIGLFFLFAFITITGWYDPIMWYVLDKAAGLTQQLTLIFQSMLAPPATP